MEIRLNATANAIAHCWNAAEAAMAAEVALTQPDPSEEFLTSRFCGHLRATVEKASDARQFETAFLHDLDVSGLPGEVRNRMGGLIARMSEHRRSHEATQSGADLGLVITRPQVRWDSVGSRVDIVRGYRRGLLAQAKRGTRRRSKASRFRWLGLTTRQKELMPRHHTYYWLLLYRLKTHTDLVVPFGWQPCREHSVATIGRWFKSDRFPDEIRSEELFRLLTVGSIGTSDESTIKTFVDPASSEPHTVEIRLFWPPGHGPDAHVPISVTTRPKVVVLQRRS